MSVPNSADFALLYVQTAAGPPAVFKLLCGLDNVSINRGIQTTEQYRRDCAKPNLPAQRKIRVGGQSWSISGSGIDNVDLEADFQGAIGVRKNYKVELYKDDGTDTGELMGTYSGMGILTTHNQSWAQDADATREVTIEGEDILTWTVAT